MDPVSTFAQCRQAMEGGDLATAEDLAQSMLLDQPRDADTWHLAGVVAGRRGDHTEAERRLARAVGLQPDNTSALVLRGQALRALGRDEDALRCYDRALIQDPGRIDALQGRGFVLAAMKRPEEAVAVYTRALTMMPHSADILIGKGNVLVTLRRYDEALVCYDQALIHAPAEAGRGRHGPGTQDDTRAHAFYFRAEAMRELERLEEALEGFEQALALKPDYYEALLGRGRMMMRLREPDEALASYDAAIRLRPDDARPHEYRSSALRDLNRLDDALSAAKDAVALAPKDASTLTGLAHTLRAMGRLDDAVGTYARVVELHPHMNAMRFNHAVCLLSKGDYEQGWVEYEDRWTIESMQTRKPKLRQPVWLGNEDIAGRRILLWAEQGHGDALHFCRYASLVADLGATVVLGVASNLRALMSSLRGVSDVVDHNDVSPIFDRQCPLMSLPLVFRTTVDTVPAPVPYLTAPVGHLVQWRDRLGPGREARIGIVWTGNPKHMNDRNRSVSLDMLQPLAALGHPLYCLQRVLRPADIPAFAQFGNIRFFGPELTDFSETAALIMQMDLVIAVDTSVAHLAGALGKPVWLMLPFAPDWRWLMDRDDTPWYPTMRLYRQPKLGDWASVIARIRDDLAARMAQQHSV
jgi:tetratricopeptide (TPR) repeat protein